MLLSICVPTFNRAGFIGEMLASVTAQRRDDVEIVVVDGASTDDTAAVVQAHAARDASIRYIREEHNSGFDADLDKAVGYANGKYCWLMSDDDLIAPGALGRVAKVLEAGELDLLVVDIEIRDVSLGQRLGGGRMAFQGVREYGPLDADAMLTDLGEPLGFFGGTIIRKAFWEGRERSRYFGSFFVHFGVIFQSPMPARAVAIAEPLVILRAGNSQWTSRRFEIWAFIWPGLVWSFAEIGEKARRAITPRAPWRGLVWIAGYRAFGAYGLAEYRKHFQAAKLGLYRPVLYAVAIFPGSVSNLLAVLFFTLTGRAKHPVNYELASSSRFSTALSRLIVSPWLGPIKPPASHRAVR